MNPLFSVPASLFKWLGVASCSAAALLLALSIAAQPDNWATRAFTRYAADIERKLYQMFIFKSGRRIAGAQIAVILLLLLFASFSPLPWVALLLTMALVVLGPELWLARRLHTRKLAVERQVDGFLLALANALKSRPSIGDALASLQSIVQPPIRQEIELAVKQMRVGATVDQVLLSMSGRVGSPRLDAAISAVLVGRQVGGNVPEILETTASSMREMNRLEGVVRTKTAEGKAQIWVLAAFPFFLMVAFSWASPGYFDPLSETAVGYTCMIIGFALWAASVVSARKILRVDI